MAKRTQQQKDSQNKLKGAAAGIVAGTVLSHPKSRIALKAPAIKSLKDLGSKTGLYKYKMSERSAKQVDQILDVYSRKYKHSTGNAATRKKKAKAHIKKVFKLRKSDLEKFGSFSKSAAVFEKVAKINKRRFLGGLIDRGKHLIKKVTGKTPTQINKATPQIVKDVAKVSIPVGTVALATKAVQPESIPVATEQDAALLENATVRQDFKLDPFLQVHVDPDSSNTIQNFVDGQFKATPDTVAVNTDNEIDNDSQDDTDNIVPVYTGPAPTGHFFIDDDSTKYKEYLRKKKEFQEKKKSMKKQSAFINKLAASETPEDPTITHVSPLWKHRPGSQRFTDVMQSMNLDPSKYQMALADTIRYNKGIARGMDITHFAIPKDKASKTKIQNKWSENVDGGVDPSFLSNYLEEHKQLRPLKEEPEGPIKSKKEKK